MKRCRTLTNNVAGYLAVDRISSLQEHLLGQILSLLPTKDAVCTSILSRRWRRVYGFLNNLEFDASPLLPHCSDCSSFITHVDTVLRVCHSVNLTRFCLKLGKRYSPLFDLESAHLHNWISFPLTRSVKEIDLRVHVKQPGKLPPEIFCLDMLEVLKIDSNLQLENPGLFGLINLKVLHLRNLVIPDGGFLTALLSTCSSLLELEVTCCHCANSQVLKISHHLLKRLCLDLIAGSTSKVLRHMRGLGLESVIEFQYYQRTDVVLDTPNLHYLDYSDNMALRYSAGNLNSLVEATISIERRLENNETYFQSMLSLLSMLANVRSLSWCDRSTPDSEDVHLKEKLLLPNLNHLDLNIFEFTYCFVLLDLLYCSPVLERLTLREGVGDMGECFDAIAYARFTRELERATPKGKAPVCLSSHLKKIEFGNFRSSEEDMLLLKYFLGNALHLQELDITCVLPDLDLIKTEIAIKNLPRKSLNCSIKIHYQVYTWSGW